MLSRMNIHSIGSRTSRRSITMQAAATLPIIVIAVLSSAMEPPRDARTGSGTPPRSLRNPTAIDDLRSGKTRTASAAWWGFNPEDSTEAIQNAINSGAATVIVPYMGQPWIVRPLRLASNQEIVFEPGVILLAKEGEFRGLHESLLFGGEVSHVTLRGYGAALRMRKTDYVGTGYPKSEWRHALDLKGATDVKVLGLSVESSGGDGIYIGSTWDNRRVPCSRIIIGDCILRENHRQGISIVSAEHVRIENCAIWDTRGTAPSAGIDFEPDDPSELLSDIEVINCILGGNAGGGFMFGLSQLNATSREVSIRVVNSVVRSSGGSGLCLLLNGEARPKGSVEFINCTFENIDYAGARCVWNADAPMKVRFANCCWQNVARGASGAPIQLEFHGAATAPGAFQFSDCYVYDDKPRPAVRLLAPEATRLQDTVTGVITIFNERATNIDPQVSRRLPQLQTQHRKKGE